ncbi:phage tail tube protein [Lachnoclostridium phytofermentans]|uniref:Phage protein n=1 Tax=Lachnoclostridium phytofermentans (strain ATCC 700394 / DSM 18823 / ISDg) TaxID=357809 RepID=A9KKK2_LACP7|nr:phage tail tube protein [Lachnoclostridium phytofermentans]ABX41173.1 phage protein [Lachnoclostridium phytofermentans ISDg]
MNQITMNAKDTISSSLAECFVTIGEERFNAFHFTQFEASFKKLKKKVPILGSTGKGNKTTGWEGTFKATMHYNSSIFRRMLMAYKNTAEDVYFEIQVTNEDPNSSSGRQTIVFKNCNMDDGILAKFDASSDDTLTEEVNGTFDDFEMPEEFKVLKGMVL